MTYQFGDLIFDLGRHELSRDGEKIKLTKLSFSVLKVLVEAAPNLVTHDELADRVWGPKRVITPENLTQRIMMLRQSLGETAAKPTYIEGVHGQGYRLIPAVMKGLPERIAVGPENRQRLSHFALTLALVLVFFGIARFAIIPDSGAPNAKADLLPPIDLHKGPTMAVLPFANMSSDPENEYVGEGISEEIMNTLVNQANLPVVARTSSFQFRDLGYDSREIGQRLNATHLLEGSVRQSGQQMRVTAQLIDAPSGIHIWSEQYDVSNDDLFRVQTDIASAIVGKIEEQLKMHGETRLNRVINTSDISSRGEASSTAYAAYLKGLQSRNRMLPDDIRVALGFLEEARKTSPAYFPAWHALIDTQLTATSVPIYIDFELTAYQRIEDWLDQARLWHPHEPYVDFMGGVMQAVNHLEWQEGIRVMERALSWLGNDASAQAMAGWVYLVTERESQARNHLERALELDPNSPLAIPAIIWLDWVTGRENEALSLLSVAEDAAGLGDDFTYFKTFLKGVLFLQRSKLEMSDKELRRAGRYVNWNDTPMRGAKAFLEAQKSGDYEAFTEVRRDMFSRMWETPVNLLQTTATGALFDEFVYDAIKQRQIMIFWYIYHNRQSPRFKELVEAIGLAGYPEPEVRINRPDEAEVVSMLDAELPLSDKEQQKYEGVYYVGDYGLGRQALVVTRENGRLHYYHPGLKGGEMIATSEHTFVSLDERNKKIEFVPNERGEIDLAFWNLGDIDYHGYRQEAEPTKPR